MELTRAFVLEALEAVPAFEVTSKEVAGIKLSLFFIPVEARFEVVKFVPGVDNEGKIVNKAKVLVSGSTLNLDSMIDFYNEIK